ncbi:Disulfide bond formation protein B [Alphaproteobacteria bacterium SO-S41]|nr:Disulfide bond formation protein B [Alphaproteobacteria bacterium SO-S41]
MLGFAYYMQYVEHLMPCILCLWQRPPHFAAAGFGLLAFLSVGGPKVLPRLFLGLAALAFLAGAGIAIFHTGVELHLWKGLAECGGTIGPLSTDIGVLAQGMNATKIVACDQPSWIFLGLSMAAWNAVLSLGLAGVALWGMLQGRLRGRFRA